MPEQNVLSSSVTAIRFGDIPAGANGAANIFVSPTGNDVTGNGIDPNFPYRTIAKGIERANDFLETGTARDVVINLAAGTYQENVEVALAQIPLGRVIIMGPKAMTIVDSGTITAISASQLTDGGKAFAADTHVGLVLRTFDPANPGPTEQFHTIRSNAATTINPCIAFFPLPSIGHSYQILRPSAVIAPLASTGGTPALSIDLPWEPESDNDSTDYQSGGPITILAFLNIVSPAGSGRSMAVRGGRICFVGIVVEGAAITGVGFDGSSGITGLNSVIPDTVFGYPNGDPLFGAALGIRGPGFTSNGARFYGASWLGAIAINMFAVGAQTIFMLDTIAQFIGGSFIGRPARVELGSVARFDGGFDAGLPFLFKTITGTALDFRNSYGDAGSEQAIGFRFEAITGDALLINQMSDFQIFAAQAPAAGGISARAVVVSQGSHVRAAAAVTEAAFPSAGGVRVQVDAATQASWAFANILEDAAAGTTTRSALWRF